MRKLSILFIGLMLAPFTSFGVGVPSFEDGKDELIVSLVAPNYQATVNLTIPADFYAKNATMKVTGMAAEGNDSAYPEGVAVKIDDTTIWKFQGSGYGPLGLQDQFSAGQKQTELKFGNGGGTLDAFVKLPKNAVIQNAGMDIQGMPPLITREVLNFSGEAAGDWLTALTGISSAGDVNGDGYGDIVIGAYWNDAGGDNAGRAYVLFGGPDMDPNPDIIITGAAADDRLGYSVSGAGDVNNDGYDDIIVGAYRNNSVMEDSGQAYIFLGGSNMDNIPDVIFNGSHYWGNLGYSVSGAGDVNNDSYDDVIIGEIQNYPGYAYIYFGSKNMDNIADVTLNLAPGRGTSFGECVSNAGDLNGDGYDDVLVGDPYGRGETGNMPIGTAHVFFGGKQMDNVTDLNLTGEYIDDSFGQSCSNAGDVNKDGYDDVIVGAPYNDAGCATAGRAYIFYGGLNMDNNSDVVITGNKFEGLLGYSVSDAGDFNKDGYDDVLVGGEGTNKAFVFFGGVNMDNVEDCNYTGVGQYDSFGRTVSSAGDVNKDGYPEILIGAPFNDANGTDSGRAYMYTLNPGDNTGILDVSITIGDVCIYSKTGYFDGCESLNDFSKGLNNFLLNSNQYTKDSYDNDMVVVPIKSYAKNNGKLVLENLRISYTYKAATLDFSSSIDKIIKENKGKNTTGEYINVPIKIISWTAGKVKLSSINMERDLPPVLVEEIKSLQMMEDTAEPRLLDLYNIFEDDVNPDANLTFSKIFATNSTFVTVGIKDNRYLSANAMDGDANDNWTGTVEAQVACTDRRGQRTESNRFKIQITNVNDPPSITSTPDETAEPGNYFQYNVSAVDGDNDILSYHLARAPANMTIESDSGKVQWLPRKAGIHEATVVVEDGIATAVQDFNIAVPNRPPVITSSPPLKGRVQALLEYNVTAEDPNLDLLNFSLLKKPDGMVIDQSNGTIRWTPNAAGSFDVSVKASDGKERAYQNFTVEIEHTLVNRFPLFTSTPVTTAHVGTLYSYRASATDEDSDVLIYSLVSCPAGMTVDAKSGRITWTPTGIGNYTVIIKALDGKGGEASQEYIIVVYEIVTEPPHISLVSPDIGKTLKNTAVFSGTAKKGTSEVSRVQMRIDGGKWTSSAGTYNWSFTLDTKTLKNGNHIFEFRAFDGKEYSDIVKAEYKVDNTAASGKGFIPMFDGVSALALVAAIGSLIRRRKMALSGKGG